VRDKVREDTAGVFGYHIFARQTHLLGGMLASEHEMRGWWKLIKEIARHVLRRPVVGVALAARVPDGKWVLIRRRDSGGWALPGGTLEWGETLRAAAERELMEEAGVRVSEWGPIVGVYSDPGRDPRFHAVTVVVAARTALPERDPVNPAEIIEVGLFAENELPEPLSHGMNDMLRDAVSSKQRWE
jgi:8-oxo-dGTP diphosphatase